MSLPPPPTRDFEVGRVIRRMIRGGYRLTALWPGHDVAATILFEAAGAGVFGIASALSATSIFHELWWGPKAEFAGEAAKVFD